MNSYSKSLVKMLSYYVSLNLILSKNYPNLTLQNVSSVNYGYTPTGMVSGDNFKENDI